MNWSSAVGSLDELRDLSVVRDGSVLASPLGQARLSKRALQVLPVN